MYFLVRLGCLGLMAGVCVTAAASDVYQWRDADGVVHSSDKPPANQKYEVRRIGDRNSTVTDATPEAQATPSEDPQCVTARENLLLLNSDAPVQQDTDGDGKPDRALDSAERAAQKTLAEAAVKAYCRPAASAPTGADPIS